MNAKLIFKGIFLFVLVVIIFIWGWKYLTPSEKIGELILQISLVFTGFGLLAYNFNINNDNRDIYKTLANEFRISAIFGIITIISSFMYLVHPQIFLFYASAFALLLCIVGFFAPVLEYGV